MIRNSVNLILPSKRQLKSHAGTAYARSTFLGTNGPDDFSSFVSGHPHDGEVLPGSIQAREPRHPLVAVGIVELGVVRVVDDWKMDQRFQNC